MAEKTRLIGVCGANLFEQTAINFLSVLKDVSFHKGYSTIAFSAGINSYEDADHAVSELELVDLCRYINLDCIIILTETLKNNLLLEKIVEIGYAKNIPVFSIDGIVEGCYNMPLDYKSAFRDIVEHVIKDHGVTCVNMLAGMRNNSFSDERIGIFKEVIAKHGIEFDERRLDYGDFWAYPARAAVERFLESDLPMPEAIICANDEMAITACSTLAEHGYRVPEDIIVTGFDDTQASAHNYPSITTCTPNYLEAINFILEQSELVKNTGKLSPCEHKIHFDVVKRQSCGCEPNTIHNHSQLVSELYLAASDASWHTLAMNSLVTSVLEKNHVEDIIHELPNTVRLWYGNFRFACLKSELLADNLKSSNRDFSGSFGRMATILYVKEGVFDEPCEQFDVREFIPRFDELIDQPGLTFVARILKNGKQVYGYTVDKFLELNYRQVQRCNEFAMFLTHSINTVLHNYELTELNHNLENANAEIAAMSIHDPLTGIYNRRGYFNTLAELRKDESLVGKYIYMVNVDLDRLKYINDNYGHSEGDFAITAVARSLPSIDADPLIYARFGGDEFTCTFIADTDDLYTTEQIKSQINEALLKLPGVSEKEYPINFSIGLCVQKITPDINIESIISSADSKMYADKAEHKKSYPTK